MDDFLSGNVNGEKYYTAAELSKIAPVRFHPGTITRWAGRGVRGHVLKSMRFGGKRLFKKSDLLDFLAKLNDETSVPSPTKIGNEKIHSAVDQMLNPRK